MDSREASCNARRWPRRAAALRASSVVPRARPARRSAPPRPARSEEHTSELQSQSNLVCRLLLEKKKKTQIHTEHEASDSRCGESETLSLSYRRRFSAQSD